MWSHDVVFSKSTASEELTIYAKYTYDALRQRIRLQEFVSHKNKTFDKDVLLLFREVTAT